MTQEHNPAAVFESALAAGGIPTTESTETPPADVPTPPPSPQGSETQPAAPPVVPTPEEMLAAAQEPGALGTQPARTPLLQKLLDQVGGDESRLAELFVNQINGSAQLHREIQTLRERLDTIPRPEQQFDASADPAVKFHSDQIATIDADIEANDAEMRNIAMEGHKINEELSQLYGEQRAYQASGDTERASETARRIGDLRAQYSSANTRFQTFNTENKRLRREKGQVVFQRDQAVSNAKANYEASIAETRESSEINQALAQETNQQFDAAMAKHAARYGVKATPDLRRDLVNRFEAHVRSLPAHLRAVPANLDTFVGEALDTMAKSWGLTPKADFTAASREKAAAAIGALSRPPVQPTQIPASQTATSWDALPVEEQARLVRAHAARVLSRGSQ